MSNAIPASIPANPAPSQAKTTSSNAETVIKLIREKNTQLGQNRETIEKYRDDEIKETLRQVDKARAEKLLQEAKAGITNTTNSIIERLFANKTPEQIDEVLQKLTPQALQNLLAIEASNDTTLSLARVQQQPSQQKDEFEKAIQIVKLMKELQPAPQPVVQQTQQITLADVIKIIESMKSGNNQGNPNQQAEWIKMGMDWARPTIDAMSKKDKEIFDMKIKELENKQPQDPIETIKYIKEMAGVIGLGGSRSEIDLRLEEMKQSERLDMKRLDWEREKAQMEADADVEKWKMLGQVFQGPIGQALQNIGNAGADRVFFSLMSLMTVSALDDVVLAWLGAGFAGMLAGIAFDMIVH